MLLRRLYYTVGCNCHTAFGVHLTLFCTLHWLCSSRRKRTVASRIRLATVCNERVDCLTKYETCLEVNVHTASVSVSLSSLLFAQRPLLVVSVRAKCKPIWVIVALRHKRACTKYSRINRTSPCHMIDWLIDVKHLGFERCVRVNVVNVGVLAHLGYIKLHFQ